MIRSVVIGAAGTILVVLFMLGFLTDATVILWLPGVLVFNAAVTGYHQSRDLAVRSHRQLFAAVAGLSNVVLSLALLSLLAGEVVTSGVFGPMKMLIFVSCGVVGGLLGSLVAVKQVDSQKTVVSVVDR